MKAKQTLLLVFLLITIIFGTYLFNLNYNFKEKNSLKYYPNYLDSSNDVAKNKNSIRKLLDSVKKEFDEAIQAKNNPVVYDNMTLDELSNKLNLSLNSTLTGKGNLIASYSLEKGVDPYMATAIILQETGCKWKCSYIVKTCNNVGGQKGSGCGSYRYFNSLDEGIMAFIDNLYKNYVSIGLTTPELINPKYAQDQGWSKKVNRYIENIKAQ